MHYERGVDEQRDPTLQHDILDMQVAMAYSMTMHLADAR